MTSKLSTVQLDKMSVSPPTLKLPQLFSLTPTSGKAGNLQRRHVSAPQTSQTENFSDRKSLDPPSSNQLEALPQGWLCLLDVFMIFILMKLLKEYINVLETNWLIMVLCIM